MPATTEPRRPLPATIKLGDLSALARVMRTLPVARTDSVARKRQLVADFFRLLEAQFDESVVAATAGPNGSPTHAAARSLPTDGIPAGAPARLAPRAAQTLERLLAGDSEKEVAARLGLSRNTVHVYVKALYRHFEVNSRGELFARFVRAPPPTDGARARGSARATANASNT